MSRILVVDDESNIREALTRALSAWEYDVVEAESGPQALSVVEEEVPDLIILDVSMPGIDGFEVVRRLRSKARTMAIPIIMLTAVAPTKGEQTGLELGVNHYLDKPYGLETLKSTVRVSLREGEEAREQRLSGSMINHAEPVQRTTEVDAETPVSIHTGVSAIDERLGDGIDLGTLNLIEGPADSGKSVLVQHVVHQLVRRGRRVAYFGAETTLDGLIAQMTSIGLDLKKDEETSRLVFMPFSSPEWDDDRDAFIADFVHSIGRAASRSQTIVVDPITTLCMDAEPHSSMEFFRSVKRLSGKGITTFLLADTFTFDEKSFARVRGLIDTHILLGLQKMGPKLIKTFDIKRLNNAETPARMSLPFGVHPGAGILATPMRTTRGNTSDEFLRSDLRG